ncbi:hypothetical protein [uncultured Alistipes sp.]|uniref:hypothetical protein n=1 Tax=uncultured Alistipes sp. TaxID=538949 RepID=UPI0026670C5D|nr:hypothetical protein [uncultured Alistipes sp.]
METVVLVMMIVVCFNYLLKQTWRKAYFVAVSAVVCALFVGLAWSWAIEQSKKQIADWLADSALMLDLAVLLTLEVALQMTFCVVAAHIHTAGRVKPSVVWLYRLLRWFPGLLIFPVLFSLLVAAIFAMPGTSFPLVAWSLAAIVAVAIPLGRWALKRLLPEKEIRLELLFLTNALIALLGIIATVNGRTAVAGATAVDWPALGSVMSLVAAGGLLGVAVFRIKQKRMNKKLK